jgi:hypothetical protein
MTRIYIPSAGPDSWQQFLAAPEKQWRTGYSAKSLAYSWEEADGFPKEIGDALADAGIEALNDMTPLLVIPEHKVPLPGGRAESQNDAFVLGSTPFGLASICIEGKVNESFGEPISKWAPDSSPGKKKRFQYLTALLELEGQDLSDIYYQLLHRTASPIIEAKRFHAVSAVMLVHSFSQEHKWFSEFRDFAAKLGADAQLNKIHFCGERSGVKLYVGWVVGNPEYLTR